MIKRLIHYIKDKVFMRKVKKYIKLDYRLVEFNRDKQIAKFDKWEIFK